MAVVLNPRAERLLARLPRLTVYSVMELLLLVLLAVQCARLFWAMLTPLGPVGEYKDLDAMRPVAPRGAALAAFDPFFRQAPGAAGVPAPVAVTTLNLRLNGVREDRSNGRGTAFITLANGTQHVFVVGEEIEPGVVLSAVRFDHVVVTRGGAAEQLYLDQAPAGAGAGASPAPPVNVAPPPPSRPLVVTPVPPPPPPPPPAEPPASGVNPVQPPPRVSQ